jgi:molybdenum cofactor cytidylyltransferase
MIFDNRPPAKALGCVLAHSVTCGERRLKKGVTLTAQDIQHLVASGVEQIAVAELEPGDVPEDRAAQRLAAALVPADHSGLQATPAFTGRVNLLADGPGLAVLDVAAIHAVNAVHPMITLATVPPLTQMRARGMVATIKMISYAVPGPALDRACDLARGAICLAPPVLQQADLIVTVTDHGPGTKGVEAIQNRLEALNVTLGNVFEINHSERDLEECITRSNAELLLILTASATSDICDVAPAAVRAAGGQLERFGMPVDPGNLLFFGRQGGRAVIGLPGCARSPALNGADWVMARIICGHSPSSADIAAMGVGGLLKEIPSRPQPRRQR